MGTVGQAGDGLRAWERYSREAIGPAFGFDLRPGHLECRLRSEACASILAGHAGQGRHERRTSIRRSLSVGRRVLVAESERYHAEFEARPNDTQPSRAGPARSSVGTSHQKDRSAAHAIYLLRRSRFCWLGRRSSHHRAMEASGRGSTVTTRSAQSSGVTRSKSKGWSFRLQLRRLLG